ncbi:hypothetical protein [Methylobacterium aerolatum]|uniref:Homogentisate 1,2-dioxygenase n=1 Tax=Methylobacterium aerolatum TaxID=418708 RepID=A0ABU0I492_9HYPH|nr:hypothetical protein [Methylobacterium aerolatum]MDQ0449438.1 hypothetical protein [Methylobacterium aerolatum]GJD37403.1 hypothetical protein FMGBMHLM_4334 [Methylobacterium aerolatum]
MLGARVLVVIGSSLLPAMQASATEPPACAGFKWPVSQERAAFTEPSLPRLTSGSAVPAGVEAMALALRPASAVTLPVPPGRTAKPGTFSGFVTATVASPGTYQVTLSEAAWVDLSQDGRTPLEPAAHSGTTGCPEVRKTLRFALRPGTVTVSIANAPTDRIAIGLRRAE